MFKRSFILGAIAGIALILYIGLLDASKVLYTTTWGSYLGYLAFIILPAAIFFLLQNLNKRSKLRLVDSLIASLFLAFIASTTYNIFTYMDIHFFNASHLQNLFASNTLELRRQGYPDSEIAQQMKKTMQYYQSYKPYTSTYIFYLPAGLLFGLIMHFVIKKIK